MRFALCPQKTLKPLRCGRRVGLLFAILTDGCAQATSFRGNAVLHEPLLYTSFRSGRLRTRADLGAATSSTQRVPMSLTASRYVMNYDTNVTNWVNLQQRRKRANERPEEKRFFQPAYAATRTGSLGESRRIARSARLQDDAYLPFSPPRSQQLDRRRAKLGSERKPLTQMCKRTSIFKVTTNTTPRD